MKYFFIALMVPFILLFIKQLWNLHKNYNGFLGPYYVTKAKTFYLNEKYVTLLGMIHVGPQEFYDKIHIDFCDNGYLTLTEGVRNTEIDLKYKEIAKLAGFSLQKNEELFLNIQNADIDATTLDPRMSEFIEKLSKVFNALVEGKASDDLDKAMTEIKNEDSSMKDLHHEELIVKRNLIVIDAINKTDANEILVPWGAAHLRDMEERLRKQGYKPAGSRLFVYASLREIVKAFIGVFGPIARAESARKEALKAKA